MFSKKSFIFQVAALSVFTVALSHAQQQSDPSAASSQTQPMTKDQLKAQKKQQKVEEKAAKQNAKAAKSAEKAKEAQDKAANDQQKAAEASKAAAPQQ